MSKTPKNQKVAESRTQKHRWPIESLRTQNFMTSSTKNYFTFSLPRKLDRITGLLPCVHTASHIVDIFVSKVRERLRSNAAAVA